MQGLRLFIPRFPSRFVCFSFRAVLLFLLLSFLFPLPFQFRQTPWICLVVGFRCLSPFFANTLNHRYELRLRLHHLIITILPVRCFFTQSFALTIFQNQLRRILSTMKLFTHRFIYRINMLTRSLVKKPVTDYHQYNTQNTSRNHDAVHLPMLGFGYPRNHARNNR